ncbi:uncharacterized protein LOC117304475 [Asterias rubens]|uniref:uncharacterized protein LOC117304475 n=1 Tax=Asterias rubens TaxID=7604 RepID=UPI0014558F71|nr:uncharacterized protein LOC117304475 [Asterias rubens]
MASTPRAMFCVHLLFRIIGMILQQQCGVRAIAAVNPPVSTVGVEGREAEFSCSVADKLPSETLIWQLEWDATKFPQYAHVGAEQNTTYMFNSSAFTETHAAYTTSYTVNGSIHTTTLHITDIQPSDEGVVSCVYQISVGGSLITRMIPEYTAARLTVWKIPSPSCSFKLNQNDTEVNITVDSKVELICADAVGVPTPNLTWWYNETMQFNGEDQRWNPEGVDTHMITLRPEDNGRWFTCEGRNAAVTEPVPCRVRPMMVPPTAEIKPNFTQLTQGTGNVEFVCTGSGLPTVKSYRWFIDDLQVQEGNHETYSYIEINTNKPNESVLIVKSFPEIGKIIISCEVSVYEDLNTSVSGTVEITESKVKKQYSINSKRFRLNASTAMVVIISGMVFFLLLIFLVLFLRYRRHRYVSSEVNNDTHTLANGEANGGVNKRRFWGYMVTSV